MQTFLPYSNFKESAKCLDYRRLGKQRVECLQILQCLAGVKTGWKNHPAVQMWKGYETALVEYGFAICREWIGRGYKDTCLEKIDKLDWNKELQTKYPLWLATPKFHISHRSNLIRKFPEHYGKLWPDIPNDLPYFWPTK